MSYTKSTLRFIKDNFLQLVMSAILPAVIMAFFFDPSRKFLILLSLDEKMRFHEIFANSAFINGWVRLGMLIPFILIWCVFLSSLVGGIERRMKYGEFYQKGNFVKFFLRKVNNNFLHLLKLAVCFVIILELVTVAETLFTFMWIKVCGPISKIILTFVTQMLFIMLFLVISSYMLLMLPNMTIKGYSLRSSLRESVRSITPKLFIKILFTLAITLLLSILPLLGHRLLSHFFKYFGRGVVQWILTFVWYWMLTMFVPAYMYTVFFGVGDIEREDLRPSTSFEYREEEV